MITFGKLVLKLQSDGISYIQDTSSVEDEGNQYTFSSPVSSEIQSFLQQNENYSFAENYLSLSKNQMIFYSLVDDYIVKNSKNKIGDSMNPPYPYGVTTSLLSGDEKDEFFSMIFETMIEKYAKRVGNAWQGDVQDAITEYSKALSQNVENIINYDQARKICKVILMLLVHTLIK